MLHLIHPACVHFSIALLLVGALVEAPAILSRRDGAARLGAILVLIGTCSLVPTVVAGFLAANSIDLPPGAADLLDRHEDSGLWLAGVFTSSQFLKGWWRGKPTGPARLAYVALLVAGATLAAWTAFLGGELVYGKGVGVGV